MKSVFRPAFAIASLWIALSDASHAALSIMVDTTTKQYYLSGSTTGLPEMDIMMESAQIFWNNQQPYNGGYPSFLALSAFSNSGTVPQSFTMFLHGNGNINGAANFGSGEMVTLVGDSSVKFSYSGWEPTVIAEIESKALAGEVLPVTSGSSAFAMTFQAVPEPTSALLVLVGGCSLVLRRRRNQSA
jgi:hypothetical protein